MDRKDITFRNLVERQAADIKSKKKGNTIYVKISLPFTYLLVKLGATPNKITLFTYLLGIFGYVFLSLGTYIYFIIGIAFFFLFYTIDSSDGDIARVLNLKSDEGIFFDEMSHYVWAICFGTGIGVGLSRIYHNEAYLFLGLAIALAITLEHSATYALRSSVKTGMINRKISMEHYNSVMEKLFKKIHKGIVWSNTGVFHKLFGVYPFNGLFYSAYFSCPILIILTLIEYLNNILLGFNPVLLIVSYLLIFLLAKLIWILVFDYNMERHRYITDTLNNFGK